MKYLPSSRLRIGLGAVAAVAGVAPSIPVAAQQTETEAHRMPAELRIWSDPWLAEQLRPEPKEAGHDAREPVGPPPVSRGSTYRSRPPNEWPRELPDDSEEGEEL